MTRRDRSRASGELAGTPVARDDVLDSWKEIASYLGRNVRTVQRWEKKEGMPVHRHQHQKKATVFAYRDELDRWLPTRDAVPAAGGAQESAGRRRAGVARLAVDRRSRSVPQAPRSKPASASSEAYRLYERGCWYFDRNTPEARQSAIEYFRQAIAQDGSFAQAYARLALAHENAWRFDGLAEADSLRRAERAVERALALDASNADAHSAQGHLHVDGLRWAEAEEAYLRARSLDSGASLGGYAIRLLSPMGRHNEAIRLLRQHSEASPARIWPRSDLAFVLFFARRYAEALSEASTARAIDPESRAALRVVNAVHWQSQRWEELVRGWLESLRLERRFEAARELGTAYEQQGIGAFWPRALELVPTRQHTYRAGIRLEIGDVGSALLELERGYEQRDASLCSIGVHPGFDSLRAHPRFRDLLTTMGLPNNPAPDSLPVGDGSATRTAGDAEGQRR